MKINKYCCIDCHKSIDKRSKRCYSCSNKINSSQRNGKLNNNFIDGRWLKKHYCIDCKINTISYSNWLYGGKRCSKCAKKRRDKFNYRPERHLLHYYCINCYTEISRNAYLYGNKHCKSCAKQGKLHPNYIDGRKLDKYPSEFNKKLRLKILKRDNYTCQKCNKVGTDVHHIDYNKQNCKETNLITLCGKCNTKVNYNRNYWYAYFCYIMEKIK